MILLKILTPPCGALDTYICIIMERHLVFFLTLLFTKYFDQLKLLFYVTISLYYFVRQTKGNLDDDLIKEIIDQINVR